MSAAEETVEKAEPPPRKPVTLEDVAAATFAEADRIMSVQDDLVACQVRAAPSEDMVRRAECFLAAARLCDRIAPHLSEFMKFIKQKERDMHNGRSKR